MTTDPRRLLRPSQVELLRILVDWHTRQEQTGGETDFLLMETSQVMTTARGLTLPPRVSMSDFRELARQCYIGMEQRKNSWAVDIRPLAHLFFEGLEPASAAASVASAGGSTTDQPVNNSRFEPEESTDVLAKMEKIAEFLHQMQRSMDASQHLADDRHAFVAQELNYLREAATRLGRKDWKHVAESVLSNAAGNVLTDQAKRLEFLAFAKNTLPGLFGGLSLPG